MKILLIEDERKIAAFIKKFLEREKYFVTVCDSIEEALLKQYEDSHDLVILDLMLRGKSGDNFIKYLKKKHCNIPILILSAITQIDKKVELLNLGADDYLAKPFDIQELIARVNALYRRFLKDKKDDKKDFSNFVFYKKQNKVEYDSKDILLTQKEADILNFLIEHNASVVSMEDILINVWKTKPGFNSNIVSSTIRRLRKKIDHGSLGPLIKNIHGVGYMIILKD